MALITRNELNKYVEERNHIANRVKKAVRGPLEQLDMSDIAKARNATIALLNANLVDGTNASAALASEFYNLVRERAVGEPTDVEVYSGYDPAALDGAVRAIIQKEVDGHHDAFINECLSRCDYEVQKAAGESVMRNGYRDHQYVRFMRVPSGSETCPFCLMLATRGAVYYSRESAGGGIGHYHSHCDCAVVPVFLGAGATDASTVEGYKPSDMNEKYQQAIDDGRIDETMLRQASKRAKARNGRAINRTAGTEGTRFPTGTKAMIRFINEADTREEFERRAVIVARDYRRYWKDKRGWATIKRAIDRKEASFNS